MAGFGPNLSPEAVSGDRSRLRSPKTVSGDRRPSPETEDRLRRPNAVSGDRRPSERGTMSRWQQDVGLTVGATVAPHLRRPQGGGSSSAATTRLRPPATS